MPSKTRENLDHIADIEPTGTAGVRGERFRVSLDGEVIIASSANPEFDACRVLHDRGLSGRVGFRHRDGMIGLITSVEAGSKLRVKEGASGSPRFRKWEPFPGRE